MKKNGRGVTSETIKQKVESGNKLGQVLEAILVAVKPGLSTYDLELIAQEQIDKAGGQPSFKTVSGYRYCSCIGLNSEVVHSLPNRNVIIKSGDLVKVDVGLIWQGWHSDTAWTVIVGSEEHQDFISAGKIALQRSIKQCRCGNRVGDISLAIQNEIESRGYRVVKSLTGHGIGRSLHQEPMIPGFLKGDINKTPLLEVGTSLAIEVIYTSGTGEIVMERDGWTISTRDGKIAGLFEQTVEITANGPLILTPAPAGF